MSRQQLIQFHEDNFKAKLACDYPSLDYLNYLYNWKDMDAHMHIYLFVKLSLDTSRD